MAAAATPDLQIVQVPIDDLHPDPANPRKIGEAELDTLTRGIKEFGFVQPIVARRQDHVVIGGHQRLVAARRLGMRVVPVVYVDLTQEQARLLNLSLNKISGTWDEQLLARMLADLKFNEVDLEVSGFTTDELNRLLKGLEAEDKHDRPETFDLEEALERATQGGRTHSGDLWQLGDHRLLCGDSTQKDAVARLLDGQRADVAFTDPPYNVNYGDHGGQQLGARRRRLQNDDLAPEAWEAFCRGWATNLVASVDGALYVCMSSREWPTVSRVLADTGGHWSDTLIWSKDRFTLGRADYQRQYEPIWYGWREGSAHHWCGDRDQGDVWSIARPSEAPLHPTMKPRPDRAGAREQQSGGGPGAGCLSGIGEHVDRRRADGAGLSGVGAGPALRRRGSGALGSLHGRCRPAGGLTVVVVRLCLDCGKATSNGSRCPDCSERRERAQATRRGSATQQGYGADWRRIRAAVLATSPDCVECGAPATDVDHAVPRRAGGTDAVSNLRPLCHACHSRKTVTNDGGFGRTIRPRRG